MANEIESLRQNSVFVLTDLPPGKRLIQTKWVFSTKRNPTGEVEKFKSRWVAQGFSQIPDDE